MAIETHYKPLSSHIARWSKNVTIQFYEVEKSSREPYVNANTMSMVSSVLVGEPGTILLILEGRLCNTLEYLEVPGTGKSWKAFGSRHEWW